MFNAKKSVRPAMKSQHKNWVAARTDNPFQTHKDQIKINSLFWHFLCQFTLSIKNLNPCIYVFKKIGTCESKAGSFWSWGYIEMLGMT